MNNRVFPDLLGVVLAGGSSRRMGRDKAAIEVAGCTQLERSVRVLSEYCDPVVVSVREDQAHKPLYRPYSLIVDEAALAGPAAGLLSVWKRYPGRALLVLAVDMPLVDASVLAQLIENRDPGRVATVFRHRDGVLEPLCAIWEAAAGDSLSRLAATQCAASPSQVLEAHDPVRVVPSDPTRLASANTPAELAALTGS